MPAVPYVSGRGDAFAYAMNSFRECTGILEFTVNPNGIVAASETGSKSLIGSYGNLAPMPAAMTCENPDMGMAVPSAGCLATNSRAMLPPAPGLFSTPRG